MKKFSFFLSTLIINVKCFSHVVLNCQELDLTSNTCAKCEDKYFPLFHNLFCLPCDDKDYGQIGCKGNCDSSGFEYNQQVYCEKNECKDGYYELNGLCFDCSSIDPGCKNCYINERNNNGKIDYIFTCEECLSDEYKMNEYGICEKCQIEHCSECRYKDSNQECLQCESDYYLSSDQTCKRCHQYVYIGNGYCIDICSDNLTDLEAAKCYCYNDYILNENKTCSYYMEGCSLFQLGKDNNLYCMQCISGYVLYEKKCARCPEGCYSCYIDMFNQTICTECDSEYALINGKCQLCSYGCSKCIINENNNTSCLECYSYYALNPNNTCTYCRSINYLGNGCYRCKYNGIKNKYECLECDYNYDSYLNKYIYNYVYIKNEFQCLSNTDTDQFYIYGCLEGNLIENNTYECLKCKEEFIPILNDKICRKPSEINLSIYCLEGINIGNISYPIYSCNKCNNETALITDLNNISNCFERTNNLIYCSKGKMEPSEDMICEECVSLAYLNEVNQICECENNSF